MCSEAVRDTGEHGDAYERFIGRWSNLVAVKFLDWLELPGGLRWVDVGCGTGALSEAILDRCDPTSVDGVEPSAGFVRAALKRLGDRATLHQAAADNMPLRDGSADVVVSGLVLNFIPDLPAAFAEMKRIASGGIVGAYVWDYGGGMDMLRLFWDAADEVDPDGIADEGSRFPICRPDALTAAFTDAGLDHPELVPLDIATPFADFDALWTPFTGGQGSGPSYLVSLDAERHLRSRRACASGSQSIPTGRFRCSLAPRLSGARFASRASVFHELVSPVSRVRSGSWPRRMLRPQRPCRTL